MVLVLVKPFDFFLRAQYTIGESISKVNLFNGKYKLS